MILLDWMLPGQSGLQLARKWRAEPRTKGIPILMLTARGDEPDKVAGLDAGADDYITKPFSTQEMLARIRAVLRRRAPEQVSDSVAIGELALDAATHRVTWQGQPVKVGPTEFKLLHYLMKHPERVHSRSQLLDKVWGDHVFIEERTVDVHVKRLRESLGGGRRDDRDRARRRLPPGCAARDAARERPESVPWSHAASFSLPAAGNSPAGLAGLVAG